MLTCGESNNWNPVLNKKYKREVSVEYFPKENSNLDSIGDENNDDILLLNKDLQAVKYDIDLNQVENQGEV